jgi:hypothetical protein
MKSKREAEVSAPFGEADANVEQPRQCGPKPARRPACGRPGQAPLAHPAHRGSRNRSGHFIRYTNWRSSEAIDTQCRASLTNLAGQNIITPIRGSMRKVAGIKSEPRPASGRNRWPASYWNAWPASSESADDRAAAHLYKLAADQGYANGQYALAVFYWDGRGGLTMDEREAARLFKLAADQGYANGQVSLAFFYENGLGDLPKDNHEALRLYKLAADKGNQLGQSGLKRLGRK